MELVSFKVDKVFWGEYCHVIVFTSDERRKFFRSMYVNIRGETQIVDLSSSVRRWLDEMNIDYTTEDYEAKYNKFPEVYLKNKEDFLAFKLAWA